jgi:hypothetical protein
MGIDRPATGSCIKQNSRRLFESFLEGTAPKVIQFERFVKKAAKRRRLNKRRWILNCRSGKFGILDVTTNKIKNQFIESLMFYRCATLSTSMNELFFVVKF